MPSERSAERSWSRIAEAASARAAAPHGARQAEGGRAAVCGGREGRR
jgi:hypothetical protein